MTYDPAKPIGREIAAALNRGETPACPKSPYDPAKLAELLAVCDRINKIRAGEHPEKVYPDADLNMVGEVGRLYQQDCDTAREHFRPLLEEVQRLTDENERMRKIILKPNAYLLAKHGQGGAR